MCLEKLLEGLRLEAVLRLAVARRDAEIQAYGEDFGAVGSEAITAIRPPQDRASQAPTLVPVAT